MSTAKNVLGTPLEPCSHDPLTGFYRNGCCDTGRDDIGLHLVCIKATAEFLEFSARAGNDLQLRSLKRAIDPLGVRPSDRQKANRDSDAPAQRTALSRTFRSWDPE